MRTLALIGTAGGAGTTTLAALAFAGTRNDPRGAPWLLGPQGTDLLDRAHDAEVAALDTTVAIWDAGVQTPTNTVALLRSADLTLVIAAPATPLGSADAERFVSCVARADQGLLTRVAVVHTEVYGRNRASLVPPGPVAFVLRLPYDQALARAGAVPDDTSTLSRHTCAAVRTWQDYCSLALRPALPHATR